MISKKHKQKAASVDLITKMMYSLSILFTLASSIFIFEFIYYYETSQSTLLYDVGLAIPSILFAITLFIAAKTR